MMSGHAIIQIAVNSVKDGAFEFLENLLIKKDY